MVSLPAELAIGETGGATMKRAKADADFPIGELKRIKDVLPAPDKLVIPEDTVKVTIFLSKSSVSFFKHQAARHRTRYQKMIRELVDRYAAEYSTSKSRK